MVARRIKWRGWSVGLFIPSVNSTQLKNNIEAKYVDNL